MKIPIVFTLLLLLSSFVFAENFIIYTEESPPLNFINEHGEVDGFSTDIVKAIQELIGDNSAIQVVPWARGYQAVLTPGRPNVALYSTTFSEERRDLFHWVGPIAENTWELFSLKNSGIVINSLEDARKVNAIGTYIADVREQYLKSRGFTNLDSVSSVELNMLKLKAGRIDLWISSELGLVSIAEEMKIDPKIFEPVYTVKEVGLFIVFNLSTSVSTVEKWQNAYQELKDNGTLQKIADKWNLSVPQYSIPVKHD